MKIPVKVYESADNLIATDYIQKARTMNVISTRVSFEKIAKHWYVVYYI